MSSSFSLRGLSWPALLFLSLAGSVEAAFPPQLSAQLPPAAQRAVDFAADIQPIFEASCVQCHARGKAKGAFSLETRRDFLAGGDSGTPAIIGKSGASLVVEMISGLDPEIAMPKKGKKLTTEQVSLVRAWIDQGMAWPEQITFFKHEPNNLRPREVALPPIRANLDHPVDRLVGAYFSQKGIAWGELVDDRTYARRVWLDTVGLLPPPAELDAFVADRTHDKRTRLVERLLADDQRYAEHWLTFWNDLLRNDYRGTGFTDGGRRQITSWLYTALARNLPYDRFVGQLLNPGADTEGFANGIIWRGAVNASMVPPMQAAQSISQVFLGVNLKCASCHDSFINEYSLADSYGLASVYANAPLEIAECDKPTGHTAKVKFLYDELGSIDSAGDPAARKQRLVEIITGRKNGRLPRTIVNRLWQRFLGQGLVEPVDEMDKPAWSPELIDWLAEDLVQHGYDLKHTMARILTSRAYQLRAVNLDAQAADAVFRGPAIRRLSAEQFTDAIGTLGGLTYAKVDGRMNRAAALRPAAELPKLEPKWIWSAAAANLKAPPGTFRFQRTVTLAAAPTEAVFAICADDNYAVKINGENAGQSGTRNSVSTDWLDVATFFKAGENVIEITAANMAPDEGRLVSVKTDTRSELASPAGLILYARLRVAGENADFVSDRNWTAFAYPDPPATAVLGPPTPPSEAVEIGAATELGDIELRPWKLGRHFLEMALAPKDTLPVLRASLVRSTPLMTALGRPNREQIVTVRQETPTTLQALELTNGATLAKVLKQAAEKIQAAYPTGGVTLVTQLYRQALGRPPNAAEQGIAEKLVGTPAQTEGIEDLVWVLTMLPEFQLIP